MPSASSTTRILGLRSRVREERGLCYAVSSSYRGDDKFGVLTAYVGTTPDRAQESLDVLTEELHRVCTPEGRITEAEFLVLLLATA